MKTKVTAFTVFIISIAIIVFLAFAGFKGFTINGYQFKTFNDMITKGLDLQGGVSVTMQLEGDNITSKELEQTQQLLSLRVNKVGVSNTSVTTEGNNKVVVNIPGDYDSNSILDTLTTTGQLTFVSPDGSTILTGSDVRNASVYVNNNGEPVITLKLNSSGTEKFAEATKTYLGKKIAIEMDGEVLTAPTVQSVISDGQATITGSSSLAEAKKVADIINAGALPVPVKVVSVETIGAQLGASALPNAMKAGAIGVLVIFLFMILNYRWAGFVSSMALSIFILLVLYAYVGVGVVLSLPGIAGLLLTIGMAVDANVLIFERIKEELRQGRSVSAAVKLGFHNALSSIIDSNVTTIIVALVLYYFGSGEVQGFALTLLIGVLISMFTAIIITRFFMNLAVDSKLFNKPSMFGRIKRRDDNND
ncbi:preprotein translocase subunit SecD [Sarcina ventriculi]|uniref:protein translocase subunit SecD n=1 Tax=Sarcina ventriculi TaxID=1267 RepID=UPI000D9EF18B|nr:protein translocase subunit SecD [Sarcina ventriculi]SPZ50696.1 preprotein translocase subunit SecD [Sarcina ventriculi]